MAGRNSQVSRIYMILNILEGAPHGLSAAELTTRLQDRAFEVTKRTVYRDLQALHQAGFPLEEKGKSDDNGTKWTLERTVRANHFLALSAKELIALYLARGVLAPLKDTPFFSDLRSTFDKIEEKLGSRNQQFLSELSSEIAFEPGQRWGLGIDPDIVETIRAACTERQVLKGKYASINSKTTRERTLGAHYLYFAKGSLYLVAEDLEERIVKVFSVPRFQSAELSETPYEGVQVDPDQFFGASFGIFQGNDPQTVKLEFNSRIAQHVKERRWHESQVVTELEEGSIELVLNVALTPDLKQWILGFGVDAFVAEPIELRDAIRSEAEKTIEMYGLKKAV